MQMLHIYIYIYLLIIITSRLLSVVPFWLPAVYSSIQMDFLIQDISVNFPYKPYGCQLSIMNRVCPNYIISQNQVVEALESKRNCLLESPTGTGKTLSLLCASLAWVNKKLGECRWFILVNLILAHRETISSKGLFDFSV